MALSRSCRSNQSISISSSSSSSIFSSTSSSSHHFSSSLSPCRCFSSSSSSQASTSGTMPETRSSRSDSARTSAGNPSNTASGGRRKPSGNRPRRSGPLPPYEQWVKGQGAQQFKSPPPGKGPHWISETPFPLNPSFLPPAPLSQKGRDELWNLHSSNPKENGVRQLSSKFSISPDRIEALLRLKALETEWQAQGKPLQTEFSKNMDRLLGSPSLPHSKDSSKSSSSSSTPTTTQISTSPETQESISPRGSIVEEFAESGNETSILGPALLEAQEKQKQRLSNLPTGGPSLKALKSSEFNKKEINSSNGKVDRPTLVVADLSVKISKTQSNQQGRPEVRSYQGAGRLARNERRAEKRKLGKERMKGNVEKMNDPTESHSRAEMESS